MIRIALWTPRIIASTQSHPHCFSFPLSSSSSSPSSKRQSPAMAQSRSIRIAVVGDVHDEWNLEEDSRALHFLQPDLVLFTGDYGNENVELVRSISNLDIPKSLILGNHDSWRTNQFSEKAKKPDRVQIQLEWYTSLVFIIRVVKPSLLLSLVTCMLKQYGLGEQHVGYSSLDFPTLQLSVVGGRPFSCGGGALFRPRLLSARYGVNDMEGSAKKIYDTAMGTPEGHTIVILAHNGPTGLGSGMDDICGRDWVYGGGDHGDPDLGQALRELKASAKLAIPLVVFGHMHKALAYGGQRKMVVVDSGGTIYLNGAVVPRVKHDSGNETAEPNKAGGTLRAFTLVEILDGRVEKISEIWIRVEASRVEVHEESTLFKASRNEGLV